MSSPQSIAILLRHSLLENIHCFDLVSAMIKLDKTINILFLQQSAAALAAIKLDTNRYPLVNKWRALIHSQQIKTVICVNAATQFGLHQAGSQQKLIHDDFILGGLGEWVSAMSQADKTLIL